jgi:molecular chaperone GrpE
MSNDQSPEVAAVAGATVAEAAVAKSTVADCEERLLRALADLDNLRKRFNREVSRERAAERARVASAWLPVVDNLERALEHVTAETDDALVEGVRAVRDQAIATLSAFGFPRFDDIGNLFDPHRHEAVGSVATDAPAGTVVSALRAGYGSRDGVLRPASVLVAKGSD